MPLLTDTAVVATSTLGGVAAILFLHASLYEATLSGGWVDLPHIPDSSLFVFESSVCHGCAIGVAAHRCEILANLDAG